MAKKAPVRKSAEQLKNTSWPDRASAEAEIKASKVPLVDVELREYKTGSWQLMPIDGEGDYVPKPRDRSNAAAMDIVAQQRAEKPGDREQKVIDSLRKKPGAKSRTEPDVILDARKKPAQKKAAAPAQPSKTPAPSKAAAKAEPPPAASTEPVVNVLSPLPVSDGPFELFVTSGEATFNANSVVVRALELSKKTKWPVSIRDKSGAKVRTIDATALKAAQKAGAGRGRPTVSGAPRTSGKSAEAAKLLKRPDGATFEEVQKITEWGISERFVRRLGRAHKCEPVKIAEKHWKLVPQPAASA